MEPKPFNVQFELDNEEQTDLLYELAVKLGKKRANRRIGAGGVAKEILIRVLKEGKAEYFLDLEPENAARPKPQTARQRSHQAGS